MPCCPQLRKFIKRFKKSSSKNSYDTINDKSSIVTGNNIYNPLANNVIPQSQTPKLQNSQPLPRTPKTPPADTRVYFVGSNQIYNSNPKASVNKEREVSTSSTYSMGEPPLQTNCYYALDPYAYPFQNPNTNFTKCITKSSGTVNPAAISNKTNTSPTKAVDTPKAPDTTKTPGASKSLNISDSSKATNIGRTKSILKKERSTTPKDYDKQVRFESRTVDFEFDSDANITTVTSSMLRLD